MSSENLRESVASSAAPVRNQWRATKILVVDDSLVGRLTTGRILEQRPDLQAIYATDGNEALVAIARKAPAVVLTDLQMPHMDGLSLVAAVRRRHSAIPRDPDDGLRERRRRDQGARAAGQLRAQAGPRAGLARDARQGSLGPRPGPVAAARADLSGDALHVLPAAERTGTDQPPRDLAPGRARRRRICDETAPVGSESP